MISSISGLLRFMTTPNFSPIFIFADVSFVYGIKARVLADHCTDSWPERLSEPEQDPLPPLSLLCTSFVHARRVRVNRSHRWSDRTMEHTRGSSTFDRTLEHSVANPVVIMALDYRAMFLDVIRLVTLTASVFLFAPVIDFSLHQG